MDNDIWFSCIGSNLWQYSCPWEVGSFTSFCSFWMTAFGSGYGCMSDECGDLWDPATDTLLDWCGWPSTCWYDDVDNIHTCF